MSEKNLIQGYGFTFGVVKHEEGDSVELVYNNQFIAGWDLTWNDETKLKRLFPLLLAHAYEHGKRDRSNEIKQVFKDLGLS